MFYPHFKEGEPRLGTRDLSTDIQSAAEPDIRLPMVGVRTPRKVPHH